MIRRIIISIIVFMAVAAAVLGYRWLFIPPQGLVQYVGCEECARCHPKELDAWMGSDHERAMDPATPATVLGDFNNQQFTHFGVTSKFFRRNGKFCVTTDGPTGKMETFDVKYTFGWRPLQQYLVEFPDGRVQCLPLAWDTRQKNWFHLYPNEPIPYTDMLHWTRPLQNWNYMCAECHSTELRKNYHLASNTFHTTWSEINVSCEACHGPGSRHVFLTDSWRYAWNRQPYSDLPNIKTTQIDACAPCHSRRRVVYPGFQAGDKFLDFYFPELLDGELYYADGQFLDEDYEYGSFVQSKMYARGVRCTDCHDAHTMRLKYTAPDAPRHQVTNNRVCVECHLGLHPAGKYDTPAHSHHPDAKKPGTLCVECHMVEKKYMGVDPRRDHSFRIPRPDLTVSLGIPNACNECHKDKSKGETPEWAVEQVRKWYGERKGPPHFAYAIAAGRSGKPEGERMLDAVTRRKDVSPMVRASAIALLGRYGSDIARFAAFEGLTDEDPLVRTAAVRSLQIVTDEDLRQRVAPLLLDPIRSVRTEAARLLSRVPLHTLNEGDRAAFDAALAEYMTGQESLGDQPAAHLNMAVIHANLGDRRKTEEEYRTALRIDPRFVPVRINLAMFYDQEGKKAEAAAELRKVIELEPKMAEAHYSLGLLLAEQEDRLNDAAGELRLAAELAPENARFHYNYGLALQRLGRHSEAEEALARAYKLAPDAIDYLRAMAILYTQQKRWARAVACAEELVRRRPDDPEMKSLLEYAKKQGSDGKE